MFFALALLSFFNQNQATAGSDSPAPQTLEVECPATIYLTEGQAYDTSVTGAPRIIANNGGTVTISWLEFFSPGNCSNKNDIVTRIFTVRNALGDLQRCTQTIYLMHLSPATIRVPADTTVSYPRDVAFSAVVLNATLPFRMITFTYTDTKLSPGCNSPIRIRREWRFTDLCTGQVTQKVSFINVQNYQNSFEHTKVTEDALCENEGFVELIPKGEFGPFRYRWNTGDTTSNALYNLSPGVYTAVVTDRFNCNQLQTTSLQSMSDRADVGGRIVTQNDYRVYPDSIYFGDPKNVRKYCLSPNGGLHYGMTLEQKKSGFLDYRLVKRTEATEGISTRDIIIVQRHILSIEKFVDTLKNFAADVNNNRNVTASDISELRRIILGIKDNFTEVLPWYFLVQNWKEVIKPVQSFQSIQFGGVQIVNFPRTNADILAMKMGDLDLSYRRQLDNGPVPRSRGEDLQLILRDRIMPASEWVDVPVYLRSAAPVLGFQFSLSACSDAEIIGLENRQLCDECFQLDETGLHVSSSTGLPLSWNENEPMFILRIQNREEGQKLSQLICLDGRLDPEYYDSENRIFTLGFNAYSEETLPPTIRIEPNPSQSATWLRTDASGPVEFQLVDSWGRQIRNGKFTHSILLETENLPSGVYSLRFSQDGKLLSSNRLVVGK